ncbi:MAG TPA: arylsulfotransferase family protein [Acetobacteraceae bacterium]|nr:arylsulfotransferase family protein [Acetobacteraceae bacterium]
MYTVAPELSAHLIDMKGRELHRWSVSRDAVMPEAGRRAWTLFGAIKPQVETGHLFANGDLLLIYEQSGLAPSDSALIKLDKDSHILWKTQIKVHHAIAVVDHQIYALSSVNRPAGRELNPFAVATVDQAVSTLSPDGTVLSTHSILDAMLNTTSMRLANIAAIGEPLDPLHVNSIDVLNSQNARFIPGATPGDVLLSLRNLDMLAVVSLHTNRVIWALRGAWRRQHDVKMLPNGHILMFDNQGGLTSHGRSRVLEVMPDSGAIVWSFAGTDGNSIDSEVRGGAQRLSGGNTLISESATGRRLEVAPDGAVVWEYVHPEGAMEDGRKIVASSGLTVTRYDTSRLSFLENPARIGGTAQTATSSCDPCP